MSAVEDCSALIRINPGGHGMYAHCCKNGFPVQPACFAGISGVPICCNEIVSARLYPQTGSPEKERQIIERALESQTDDR